MLSCAALVEVCRVKGPEGQGHHGPKKGEWQLLLGKLGEILHNFGRRSNAESPDSKINCHGCLEGFEMIKCTATREQNNLLSMSREKCQDCTEYHFCKTSSHFGQVLYLFVPSDLFI